MQKLCNSHKHYSQCSQFELSTLKESSPIKALYFVALTQDVPGTPKHLSRLAVFLKI